jgi:hypothetical protein
MLAYDYLENPTAINLYEFIYSTDIFDQNKLDNQILNYITKGKISCKVPTMPEIK